MFSGITNQVSSLTSMFSKNADEEVPTPPQSATAAGPPVEVTQSVVTEPDNNNMENPDKQSPTKASGGMFSNVTGKVSGWLPSSLPSVSMPTVSMPTVSMPHMPSIPGLRKSTAPEDGSAAEGAPEQAVEAQPAATHEKDDDDRSSATGGADSRPVSEKGSPTEDQAGMVGNVTNKMTAGAKSFGSFFSGVANKAGAKIKETVKDNSILGAFNKEQEAFIKDQSGKGDDAGVCPWIGHGLNEDKIKEEILSLSGDRRNFVRAPPAGIDFEFNYDSSYPTALALMSEDSQLEKMRFDLVPKIITEENFWRNYFYRVSLIIQAGDLGTLGTDDAFGKRDDDDVVSKAPKESSGFEVENSSEIEFISDKFNSTNERYLAEIQHNMTKLGVAASIQSQADVKMISPKDEEWEKDLAAEDFELVDDQENVDESELDLDLK